MRRPMLLMFVFSLYVVTKVHCDENIGPILSRIDDLSDEVAQVKKDLFRVEDKIRTQIDVAKISLRVELIQGIKQNVRHAFAEVLEGESINEIVRSQVVSEVRQLKRANLLMRRQLHHMHNSLRDMQKERDEYKDALGKTEKQSREVKCIIYPEETGRETHLSNSFTQRHLAIDQAISNLSLQIQSTKMSQDLLNTSMRNDLFTARSEIKSVQTSVNATREELILTKANLAQLRASHEEALQDISTIAAVNTSIGALWQQNMVVTSRFNVMQQRIVQFEKVLNNTDFSVAFEVTQKKHPLTLQANQIYRFDTVVLNNGGGYHVGTGVFEAPVSGVYLFWANVLPVGGPLHAIMFKDSSSLVTGHSPNGLIQCSLTYLVMVNRGEKVWFKTESYSTDIWGNDHSAYGGVLIQAQ